MASAISSCPACGKAGRWGFDDDWCHESSEDASACSREGFAFDAEHEPGCMCGSCCDRAERVFPEMDAPGMPDAPAGAATGTTR